ncbi:uncharacterized protein ssbp2b isoform X12 [Scleropages formosus]|uniref:uncharacterized protein ssbp2b isoform X12 n=1 Tax=Scleropages formosus TaxID=113540 RepID=UPI0010FAC032|nr:uncharacterized protein LOC108930036 isoform X12 [Scleropages formosus]
MVTGLCLGSLRWVDRCVTVGAPQACTPKARVTTCRPTAKRGKNTMGEEHHIRRTSGIPAFVVVCVLGSVLRGVREEGDVRALQRSQGLPRLQCRCSTKPSPREHASRRWDASRSGSSRILPGRGGCSREPAFTARCDGPLETASSSKPGQCRAADDSSQGDGAARPAELRRRNATPPKCFRRSGNAGDEHGSWRKAMDQPPQCQLYPVLLSISWKLCGRCGRKTLCVVCPVQPPTPHPRSPTHSFRVHGCTDSCLNGNFQKWRRSGVCCSCCPCAHRSSDHPSDRGSWRLRTDTGTPGHGDTDHLGVRPVDGCRRSAWCCSPCCRRSRVQASPPAARSALTLSVR